MTFYPWYKKTNNREYIASTDKYKEISFLTSSSTINFTDFSGLIRKKNKKNNNKNDNNNNNKKNIKNMN